MLRIHRWLLLAVAVGLVLSSPSSPLFAQCGVERESVKTGTDPDASKVNLGSSTNTTIVNLRAFPTQSTIPANNRIAPEETTVWVVNATLTLFKLESDSDYHLVIQDAAGNTMITEIPAPSCVGSTSPFLSAITNVRAKFDAMFTATTSFQTANIPVQITGVGMFDFPHGQSGAAPNQIELHPVLDIVFNPSSAAPDFSMNPSPASLTLSQGASGSTAITSTVTAGFNSAIALSASGLPSGVTASFSPSTIAAPGSGNSTVTFATSSTAATGTTNVTITGTGGGVTHTITVPLTINAAASPNFTLSLSPTSLSFAKGSSGMSTITTAVSGGFNSAISLSASGLPAGVTASFNPASLAAPGVGNATVTFTAATTAATGTTNVTVTASGGGVTQTATVPVTINANNILGINPPDHVVIVMEENHSFSSIIGSSQAPFINSLAQQGALFTQSFAVEHPSQPNYLDLFSGTNQGITDDSCPHTFSTENLASELTAKGLTFTGFSEDLPSAGSTVCTSGAYARKHAPWINFSNISTNANQPLTSFPTDFTTLPTISFVIPNQNNDMHDGTIAQGDTFLQQRITGYMQFAQAHNSLLIVTWDEDDNSSSNQVATIFVGPMVKQGQFTETINHFNVLRTLEDLYGLAHVGSAANATAISDVWKQVIPDFVIMPSPAALTMNQGTSTSSAIAVTPSGGFNSAVSLSASGMPAGVTVSFSPSSIAAPGSGSSTLTITASSVAAAGTFNLTITGAGGGVTHTAMIAVTITAVQPPDFTLSLSPSSLSVTQGNTGSTTISTSALGGFNSAVSLSASGLPTGVTASFSPASVSTPGSSNLVLTAASTAATGPFTVTITGNGGGIAHTATLSLTVNAAQVADFTVNASPSSLSLAQGTSGSSTITTSVAGGFNSAVALSISGLPTGVTASFSTASIAAPGSGSSTLTFTASSTATAGTANVTVTATGGSVTHTAVISLTITANQAADFVFSASPTSLSVAQGTSGSATISSAILGGFNAAISLSASGTPAGVTASFNPASLAAPGGGNSTLTITASGTAATGTFNLTLTAVGSGITHTTTVAVTITASGGSTTSQILGNPGFENGPSHPAPWTLTSTHSPIEIINSSASEPPHSGAFDAWLDGFGTTNTDTILQQVTIPSNATAATLSFWLHIDTAETTTTRQFDTLTVQVRDSSANVLSTLATFSNLNHASGYQQHSYDLSSFKGQTIQIFVKGQEDFEFQTSFVLDDFALNVTAPSGTDTTPPTTSITSPANGATVSGNVTVKATASDNVGVTQIQLLVDGNLVYTTTNSTSLTFGFDTTSVANGSHTLVTKAFDAAGNVGTSATITITVSNGTGGTVTELIGNGGFENGNNASPWVQTSSHSPLLIINSNSAEPPHSGTFDAWLDGFGSNNTDTILQQVSIPSTATAANLSFWLHIDTAETTTSTKYDTLTVQVRDSNGNVLITLASFSNLDHASGYQQHSYDLSPFIGKTIQIFMNGTEDFELQTSFVVDDVSVKVTQ
ncbi:MAG TPA: alkaline phosphatase family protein [Candidatus Saccharimonadales bacterium]|nr:alkaline phosphatase family protein [Candidatus Saccharimonadales bacterium]